MIQFKESKGQIPLKYYKTGDTFKSPDGEIFMLCAVYFHFADGVFRNTRSDGTTICYTIDKVEKWQQLKMPKFG